MSLYGMSYQQPIISSIRLENLEVSAQQAADDAAQVKIDVQGLHDLTLQYRNDAQFYFEQVQQFQEGDYVTTLTFNDALAAFSFADLASVPSEYNPSAHRHSWTELDDVPLTFAPSAHRHDWNDLDNVPVEFEPAEHVHTWQQISGKPATFPPEIHVHDWSEIQNKPSAFMPVAHQHSWADITGKPSTYAPSAHNHEWTEIQNKPDLLNVGDFGIGKTARTDSLNLDSDPSPDGFGVFFSTQFVNPPPFWNVNGRGWLMNFGTVASGANAQIAIDFDQHGSIGWRNRIEEDWREFWHSGNMVYAKNETGTGVNHHDAIGGASLNPPMSGTWRNITGVAVSNNMYGVWRKV